MNLKYRNMEKHQLEELLFNATYIYAKTMPKFPHEYTLKRYWTDYQAFIDAVEYIRNNGREEYFFKKKLIYYYASDGNKYWTMGAKSHETTLINRAKY